MHSASAPTTDDPYTATFPLEGDQFACRYRIESLLGSGGYSRVYAALQEDLGRRVALKVFAPSRGLALTQAERAQMASRFEREARILSQLRSPHTLQLFDYGVTHEGSLYQVCELIHGQTLAEVIASQGALEPERVKIILAQLLWSLKEAHGHGILHRDLKPPNVMIYDYLGQRDCVKLLDFGIAKALIDEALSREAITREGLVVGTPRYMAPEQIHGETLSASTDLYALGVFAYEMLTGRHPLDEPGVSRSDLYAGRVKLSDHGVALPETLVAIVEAMMLPHPSQRPSQCEEVLDALGPVLQRGPAAPGRRAPLIMLYDVDPRGATTSTQLVNATEMTTSELIAHRPPEDAIAAPTKQERPPTETASVQQPTKRSGDALWRMVALVLLVCLGALIATLWWHSTNGSAPEPVSSELNTPPSSTPSQEQGARGVQGPDEDAIREARDEERSEPEISTEKAPKVPPPPPREKKTPRRTRSSAVRPARQDAVQTPRMRLPDIQPLGE